MKKYHVSFWSKLNPEHPPIEVERLAPLRFSPVAVSTRSHYRTAAVEKRFEATILCQSEEYAWTVVGTYYPDFSPKFCDEVPLDWELPDIKLIDGKLPEEKYRPITCCDFDGVLHNYSKGWSGAHVIDDKPVKGAIDWIREVVSSGLVEFHIYSSRSLYPGAIEAMKQWLTKHGLEAEYISQIEFPTQKPPAHFILDDRAMCFRGKFPHPLFMARFTPWNKKDSRFQRTKSVTAHADDRDVMDRCVVRAFRYSDSDLRGITQAVIQELEREGFVVTIDKIMETER